MSVEPSGELAVYPGSVLHLECLHARKHGEPEWSWTSTYRTYPTGKNNFLLFHENLQKPRKVSSLISAPK